MKITNLECEYWKDPLGIGTASPCLSWVIESDQRNIRQRAYRILAAATPESLENETPDLWDSGWVNSSNQRVQYSGKELTSHRQVWWKVMIRDRTDQPTAWSEPACFETGLLRPDDWSAEWIGIPDEQKESSQAQNTAPMFRKTTAVSEKPVSARAYICGLGFHELYINGKKAGDHVLSPNQTDYDDRPLEGLIYPFENKTFKRVCYVTRDVTELFCQGENTIGVLLGNGWYNQRDRQIEGPMWYGLPKCILQLELTLADGSIQRVVTDNTWKMSLDGPIVRNSIFVGETYDARREQTGWNRTGFDDSTWSQASRVRAPEGKLCAQIGPPDRVMRTVKPVSFQINDQGNAVYDMGANMSGWARIQARGNAGEQLSFRFYEENEQDYGQTDTYIFKGDGVEEWEPRFTWHCFRYMEVSGAVQGLSKESVEFCIVHSDVKQIGIFESSNKLFDSIHRLYVNSQTANMHMGVTSDCPHRERLGYTGDGQVAASAAMYALDGRSFYRKWTQDIRDTQNSETGFIAHTAPFGGGAGGYGWGAAVILIPWQYYLHYGDRDMLAQSYPAMKKWFGYMRSKLSKKGLLEEEEPGSWNLGDWALPGKENRESIDISPALVNTCLFKYQASLMKKITAVLDPAEKTEQYTRLEKELTQNVNQTFLDRDRGYYRPGREGADIFPLAFDMVPEDQKERVIHHLLTHITKECDTHIDTGMIATPLILQALTDLGHPEIAFDLMNARGFPSYSWMIENGATSLWEHFSGHGSRNHPMLGSVCAWFYNTLAGIRPVEHAPGFAEFIIKPHPVRDLTHVNASCQSMHGRIRSQWTKESQAFRLHVEIPPNTRAAIHLPAESNDNINENGRPLACENQDTCQDPAQPICYSGRENGYQIFSVGSGAYDFEVKKGGIA